MLTLPRSLSLTPDQFAQVCAANPEAVLELAADGTLIEITPNGGNTSARNSALVFQLQSWARTVDGWIVFESSGGFRLADGSVRSPDASLVRLDRWRALSEAEREGFPPLCPDLVVELASPSDQLEPLRQKMASYISSAPCVMPPGWRRLRSFPAW